MQLKTTTDYAIRTILYLTLKKPETVSSNKVATNMGIPRQYLIQIGAVLREAGLIHTHAGKHGGYSLAKEPEQILLYDIINAMEETTRLNRCLEEDEYCSRFATKECPVRRCYSVMQSKWDQFLQGLTVTDILNNLPEEEIVARIECCQYSGYPRKFKSEKGGMG